MANQKNIDKASEQIADIIDKGTSALLADLYQIKRAMTLGEFIQIVSQLDIASALKAKLKKATSVYANAHKKVLESTVGFAKVESNILTGLATLNSQLFDNSIIRVISGHIRTQIVKGVQAGLPLAQIAESVSGSSLSNAQMRTLINTALNSYSRQVTNQMMKEASDKSKYVYIGPIDEKTREECIEYASAGALTLDEIEANGWSETLVDGGGFNCRHKWEIASREGSKFHRQKEAKEKLNA